MSDVFVHPSAVVDDGADIGPGTKVWHFVHVSGGAKIGKNCVLGQNVYVGNKVVIGNNVKIQNNVSVYDNVTLEDDVFCGPSMVFTNDLTPRAAFPKNGEFIDTIVRKGATIGANATIICGVELGEHCFIGAGTVITKDVPAHALVVGNPARQIGWSCLCGKRLVERRPITCEGCGRTYSLHYNTMAVEPE